MSRLWMPLALGGMLSVTAPSSPREPMNVKVREARPELSASAPPRLTAHLRNGAFPSSDSPDVGVHIPPGFDPTRRPGLVLYFHGWQGCVAVALADEDVACEDGGAPHPGADLAHQVDAARVNAILVAIELRVDQPTGEPGRLAMPAGARELLRELFAEHLSQVLGSALDVDQLDRIVVIAHSGGYQAAAGVLAEGDLPQITEVDLLDALYGAEDVFTRWIGDDIERFDPRNEARLRFVDLYTCCGGTAALSRSMANSIARALGSDGISDAIDDDDGDPELNPRSLLAPSVVFKRVPQQHGDLPRAYVRPLLEAAGFAHVSAP